MLTTTMSNCLLLVPSKEPLLHLVLVNGLVFENPVNALKPGVRKVAGFYENGFQSIPPVVDP